MRKLIPILMPFLFPFFSWLPGGTGPQGGGCCPNPPACCGPECCEPPNCPPCCGSGGCGG